MDRRYLTRRPLETKWSNLIFPREKPSTKDFRLWAEALANLSPGGRPNFRMGGWKVTSHKIWQNVLSAPTTSIQDPISTSPCHILEKWGNTWMWESIQWVGDDNWIAEAIKEGSCTAVTDGSYMKDLHLQVHLAAFVFECSKGRGRLWGSFPEASRSACSYKGELVGLMAIHLLLLAVNKVNTS